MTTWARHMQGIETTIMTRISNVKDIGEIILGGLGDM
jgi:hypothetical protein